MVSQFNSLFPVHILKKWNRKLDRDALEPRAGSVLTGFIFRLPILIWNHAHPIYEPTYSQPLIHVGTTWTHTLYSSDRVDSRIPSARKDISIFMSLLLVYFHFHLLYFSVFSFRSNSNSNFPIVSALFVDGSSHEIGTDTWTESRKSLTSIYCFSFSSLMFSHPFNYNTLLAFPH